MVRATQGAALAVPIWRWLHLLLSVVFLHTNGPNLKSRSGHVAGVVAHVGGGDGERQGTVGWKKSYDAHLFHWIPVRGRTAFTCLLATVANLKII